MAKWPSAAGKEKKYRVKVKPLKLEGIVPASSIHDMVVLKVKWEGPKSGGGILGRMMMRSQQSNYSTHKFLRRRRFSSTDDDGGDDDSGEEEEPTAEVEWDGEEFESVCSFGTASSREDSTFSPWDVTLTVLYGKEEEFKNTKLRTAGSISLNVAQIFASRSNMETNFHIVVSLPISLHIRDATCSQAVLSVSVSFDEVRNADKAPHQQGISFPSTKDQQVAKKQTTPSDSSSFRDQQKKRRLMMSFGLSWKTRHHPRLPPPPPPPAQPSDVEGKWEAKEELISRDGGAKLVNASVFLASFDQRSEKAAGESACAAVVAVIAHWLHSNPHSMPTRPQFDGLIAEGSSEWRNLCRDESLRRSFPDNHFDLDTVLEKSHLRPLLTISDRDSFTGIFSPEKFQHLKGATSFDEVWRHVSNNKVNGQGENDDVYIVSWNDHFFLLKAESDAYYIIDSLGERLHEGCDRAYVLKFDESTVMYEKAAAATATTAEEDWKVVCEGKECCGEYMKRFLAAVTVRELEEQEKKGNNGSNEVSTLTLLQRLQIDFHSCSLSSTTLGNSSSSSPVKSPTSSFFSDDEAQISE